MEPTVRKLLPRIQTPTTKEQKANTAAPEPIRNGIHSADLHATITEHRQWQSAIIEETGQKRKRQHVEDRQLGADPLAQALPSVQHLLTARQQSQAVSSASQTGHARLIRASDDAYIHEGLFRFRSPPPQRDFPLSILEDPRPLGFASIEPDLMDIFRRAWYLRQYIRLKLMRGESWLDHIFFNDCFGVENALYTWSSRYEPGMVQYSASKLYAHCLWLFFNRSVQASQASPAYAQVVEDGLHYVRGIENALGSSGDRSILLLPLFLLGASAFYTDQRRVIWEVLDRLDPSCTNETINHAAKSLERIWGMMDDGRQMSTWEWEKFHAYEHVGKVNRDRSLVDFLMDPLAPLPQSTRLRSPDEYEFDSARLRAASIQQPPYASAPAAPSIPTEPLRPHRDADAYIPSTRKRTPHRNQSVVSVDMIDDTMSDRNSGKSNHDSQTSSAPRALVAATVPQTDPPTSAQQQPLSSTQGAQVLPTNDVIQVLHRKTTGKSRSTIPPCPTCGKELKNPSDAQKHQLQHSKPFRCHEPNCTRAQGFATENDLQRHRKSVHGASPRIGNKTGYVCAACPEPSDGTMRKWWPRLDNFKAHVRRKHPEREEEGLINLSASTNRPSGDGSYSDYYSSTSASLRWPDDNRQEEDPRSNSQPRSRQTSTYDYAYSNYDDNLRESPEAEDDEDEEYHDQQHANYNRHLYRSARKHSRDGEGENDRHPIGAEVLLTGSDGGSKVVTRVARSEESDMSGSDGMHVETPNGKADGREHVRDAPGAAVS